MISRVFICFFFFSVSLFGELRNLDKMQQWFILGTKKIDIPGYPDAFNPSIVRWNGGLLMSFRIRDPATHSTDRIGLIWLSPHFDPIGAPMILKRREEGLANPSLAQDPRLIVLDGQLFMIYSNQFLVNGKGVSRMAIGLLEWDGSSFITNYPTPLLCFEGENQDRKEKNWTPFCYRKDLLLAYSLQPHKIFRPLYEKCACDLVAMTRGDIKWPWGDLRGGTPALEIGHSYLAFFHSCKALQTVQSEGKMMPHYFMGAYTFDLHPPFALQAMSPQPLVGETFYRGPMYKTWKSLRVIFPGGYVYDDEFIWVVYGRQDHEIWVVRLDRKGLLNSLRPVPTR
jgi:predicted GH43/DUF377 family glycosyl hydrolase